MNGRWAVSLLLAAVLAASTALWVLQLDAGYTEFTGAQHGLGPSLMRPGEDLDIRVTDIRGHQG